MKYYLSDIIPRLKKYSASLDQSSFLIDKPWVVAENDDSFEKLIFRSDGRVHLSHDGNVTTGKWEYLPEAQSLLINYGDREVLYRHQYLDKAVLALKKDGKMKEGDYYLLANEQEIPDLKVKKYLNNKYLYENNIEVLELDNGDVLHITNDGFTQKVSGPNGEIIPDGIYTKIDRKYLVKEGLVISKLKKNEYDNITIWQEGSIPRSGDIVENVSTGSFLVKTDLDNYEVKIEGKKVIDVKNLSEAKLIIYTLSFILMFILFIVILVYSAI